MTNFTESQCSCPTCVGSCEHRPCWPTPEEAQKIIDAGFGNRLMRDYWSGDGTDGNDIQLLSPAIVGYEGKVTPWWPEGHCTFLKKGLCQLHDLGLKPLEGRITDCSGKDQNGIHKYVALTWNNEEAQQKANNFFPPVT